MNIAIQVDSAELREAFRKAPIKTTLKLREWVSNSALLTERIEKQEVPVDKGPLQNSIHINQSGLSAEVKPTIKYAGWVHEGTGIYGPKKRPITPKHGKYMVFTIGDKKIFARSIKGQKPNRFADRTYKIVKPRAERAAEVAIDELLGGL